ncbi:hypothetical protein NLJ89_g9996 [Agrocybe chaxingu]|uniref:Protein kinase domain-containing protein n=1 Tax=Agrocybe chaxingu TaxID=84603 RepID=A0A9W8JZI8_9AGAR|nr:hypothetical protein NLJ89_g9996 [Agrocybe chaxingu]
MRQGCAPTWTVQLPRPQSRSLSAVDAGATPAQCLHILFYALGAVVPPLRAVDSGTEPHPMLLDGCYEYIDLLQDSSLVLEPLPFHITSQKDVYSGRLDGCNVVVKSWRGMATCSSMRRAFIKRLRRELEMWQRATEFHPNIAPFLGLAPVGQLGSVPALVLARYGDGNARDYLDRRNLTTRERASESLQIAAGVADALCYLHSRSPPLVHGSIRGSNVLISSTGEPLLTDLGMRNLPYPTDLTMMNSRQSLNDVRWMAPELVDGSSVGANDSHESEDGTEKEEHAYPITPGSDLYSFGMTMLELITGKDPFHERRHAIAVLLDMTRGVRPARPSLADGGISDGLWVIMTSCWKQDPAERPDAATVYALRFCPGFVENDHYMCAAEESRKHE